MSSTQTSNAIQLDEQAYYQPTERTWTGVNVGQTERWLSALTGGGLTFVSLLRRDQLSLGLGALGIAMLQRGLTGHSYLYQLFDITTVEKSPSTKSQLVGQRGMRVQRRLTIKRSSQDLYNSWCDLEKAPLYMPFIESVMKTGERTSHWIATSPTGQTIEWNAEILQEQPGRSISWHIQGSPITANAGKVTFEAAPDGRGTVVTLELDYRQFSGSLKSSIGRIMAQIPEREALEMLRRFKELMEAGEVASVQGQPTGEGRKEGIQL